MANCIINIKDYTISNFIKVAKKFTWLQGYVHDCALGTKLKQSQILLPNYSGSLFERLFFNDSFYFHPGIINELDEVNSFF